MDKEYTIKQISTESTTKQLIPSNRKGKPNRNHTFAGPPKFKLKIYFNKMINLPIDPLDNLPLSKNQIQIIFLPNTSDDTIFFTQITKP